jgi:hypothetical protein
MGNLGETKKRVLIQCEWVRNIGTMYSLDYAGKVSNLLSTISVSFPRSN